MATLSHGQKLKAILTALKMRLYLSFGFGYSKLFPTRDVLLIRADKNVRRRVTSIQRLPVRIIILTTVGLFFYFLVAENKTGMLLVMVLLPPVIIPVAALLGAFVTARVDSIEVCLRREYAKLSHERDLCQTFASTNDSRQSVWERMHHHRLNWYQQNRAMLRQQRKPTRLRCT